MKKTMGKKIVTSFLKGMMLTLLVLGVLTVPLGNEKLVLADEEPVASVQATETAEPVAEVKASETTEPVAEVQVTETAEPVAEVQVTEAAEPVAEVQETETTQPVAEVQASETTQPVTEVQASEAASTEAYTETARLAQKATNPVQDPGFEYFQTRDPYNQQDVFYNSDNPYWQADRGSMVTNIPWGTEAAPGLGVRTLNLRNSYLLNSYGVVHQNVSLVP